MIIFFIVTAILALINTLTFFLPISTLLPIVGGFDIDAAFSTAMGYFRSLIGFMPLFGVIFNAFLFYFLFRIFMLTLRLFRIIR